MITVILQASNYKESLQNRSFQMIQEVPAISYIIRRIKQEADTQVVLAVSDMTEDDIYVEIAKAEGVEIYRGAYDNLLERLSGAARASKAENFVRVYANYPLLDIEQMKQLYDEHIKGGYDYSYNEHQQGVLWGTGCEVFRTGFLIELNGLELQKSQREAIGFYIRQSGKGNKILKKHICQKRPGYKVCLETKKDLAVIKELSENLGDEIVNEKIIDYFSKHSVLGAYNVEEPAKEVGLEKAFLHPEKIRSLLTEKDLDKLYPVSVELTLTNQCNLNCVYCSDNDLRKRQGKKQALSYEVIERLLSDLAEWGTKGIVLEGGGEPTLYPEFSRVIKLAKEKGLGIGLITNGTVSLDAELIKEFEWIRVSLDASTSKEYMELKGVDYFEQVVNNITHYAKYCDTVGVGYVVTNKNLSQIETLVMRIRESGAAYIQLRPVVDSEELYPYDVDLSFLKFYQNHRFAVIVDGMKENAKQGNGNLPCKAHSLTSVISGDGSVYLCGRLNIYRWLRPIGNINTQSFHEIWLGKERSNQVEMVKDKEFCKRNCPQCRITKFNELLDRLENVGSKHFI